ncbi:MAG: ATP-binding protein [Peptococcaceae bacterium]|nr:ATP-binding protein [Peptococcaceae bacterium]
MNPKNELIALYAKQLRIPSFTQYQEVLRQQEQLSYEDFLIAVMKQELDSRSLNQQKRRIKQAGFPNEKNLEEFDFKRLQHVEEAYVHQLASCDFIRNRQNVLMIGNPGSGKTHLSIALGLRACQAGFRVKFTTAATLATILVEAKETRELLKLERQLQKADLLIIDELSYLSFNRHQSELLFKVISDRAEKSSVIISTNLEFSRWTELFENPTLVAALVDRLTFRSHILNMNNPSYRMEHG